MKRWQLILVMAAMLCIGFIGGMVMTKAAHADNPPLPQTTTGGRYQIIMIHRIKSEDPVAIWLDTQTGKTVIIFSNGSSNTVINAQ